MVLLGRNLKIIFNHISITQKKNLIFLIFFMFFVSTFEILSIGSVLPFLNALSSKKDIFFETAMFVKHFDVFELGIIFCIFFIAASVLRILLLVFSNKVIFSIGNELSVALYKNLILKPYLSHLASNSSNAIANIREKNDSLIFGVISPLITMASNIIMIIFALSIIFIVAFKISFGIFVFLTLTYFIIHFYSKYKIKKNSLIVSVSINSIIQNVQETIGGIKGIIINNSQKEFISKFSVFDKKLKETQASNIILSTFPKFILEGLGVTLLVSSSLLIASKNGFDEVLPTIGVIALTFQRILPLVQQAYQAFVLFKGTRYILSDVAKDLNKHFSVDDSERSSNLFEIDKIRFLNVSFSYPKSKDLTLNNVSFSINKGDKVAIIGETGAGKSTLIDLIASINMPTGGFIHVNRSSSFNVKNYQSCISYVPQNIFIKDGTILENITLYSSSKTIDQEKLSSSVKVTQLHDFIESLEFGYDTAIGENGAKISGGQKQRIGLARAIYSDKKLLILDEATSALDTKTEKNILKALFLQYPLITVIMVTHKKNILKYCSKIYELKNKKVIKIK